MTEQPYTAVCSEHLAVAVIVQGPGNYELRVPRETYLGCVVCDSSAKFAFRKAPRTPLVLDPDPVEDV